MLSTIIIIVMLIPMFILCLGVCFKCMSVAQIITVGIIVVIGCCILIYTLMDIGVIQ